MKTLIKFNRGILRMPLHWQAWVLLLVGVNGIAPLFFFQYFEAKVVLGTMLASMVFMLSLTARFGFTRIIGFGHILWVPMLIFLSSRLGQISIDDSFGIWVRSVVILNTISLVLDALDVRRYFAGDRSEIVPEL